MNKIILNMFFNKNNFVISSGEFMKKKKILFHDLFYTFLFGCFMGWIVEGIWTLVKKGQLINHTALVLGPFNIIYGVGAVILTLVLFRVKNKRNFDIFVLSFFTGSLLEYVISFMMEHMLGFVAWSYHSKPLNINGRICLPYSLFWGFLGILWIKMIYPKIIKLIHSFHKKESMRFMKIAIAFLLFDVVLTIGAIHRGKEYEIGIEPKNRIDEMYDKYFGVAYLNNMFNNRWNR